MSLKHRLLKTVLDIEEDSTEEAVFDAAVRGYRLKAGVELLWEVHEPTREKLKHDKKQLDDDLDTTYEFVGVLRRYLG